MSITMQMRHRGDGEFVCRYRDQIAKCNELFPAGDPCKAVLTRPRSQPHHNFFFKKIERLWDNLPEGEQSNRFPTPERLRKYLLMRAGHCEQIEVPLMDIDEDDLRKILRAFQGFDTDIFYQVKDRTAAAYKAKSIEHSKVDQDEFVRIDKRVNDVIQREFGVNPDDLMESAKRDAA